MSGCVGVGGGKRGERGVSEWVCGCVSGETGERQCMP